MSATVNLSSSTKPVKTILEQGSSPTGGSEAPSAGISPTDQVTSEHTGKLPPHSNSATYVEPSPPPVEHSQRQDAESTQATSAASLQAKTRYNSGPSVAGKTQSRNRGSGPAVRIRPRRRKVPSENGWTNRIKGLREIQSSKKRAKNKRRQTKARQQREEEDDNLLAVQAVDARIAATHGIVQPVRGDGNCLFHALARLLGNGATHLTLRRLVVEHMRHRDNIAIYRGFFVDEDEEQQTEWQRSHEDQLTFIHNRFNRYLEDMAQPGTYAGDLELSAAAEMFG